ncbi:hypothetical protein JOD18_004612 [Gracilibacillus alcaliphilus]|nr:hypothetical protein [Gracilibacillus alcaliphilus]
MEKELSTDAECYTYEGFEPQIGTDFKRSGGCIPFDC